MKIIELTEDVKFPDEVTIEQILKMYDAGRRAIAIVNKERDPARRKRHISAIFKNLNVIKGMMMKLTEPEKD